MRPQGNGYFLREYGSWSVLTVSYLIGAGVSGGFTWTLVPVFLALSLLINSKQAFMKWLRQTSNRTHLGVFLGQVAVASGILIAAYGGSVPLLLPLLILPAAYLLSNKLAGEHFVLTELLGFALLSLAAVLAKFTVVEGIDVRLLAGTAMYFTAGVFKVKAVLLKKMTDRVLTVLYIVLAAYVYHRMHISLLILLPLLENAVMAATLYKVRLQTTGWIEVAKSLAFLTLFIIYY